MHVYFNNDKAFFETVSMSVIVFNFYTVVRWENTEKKVVPGCNYVITKTKLRITKTSELRYSLPPCL